MQNLFNTGPDPVVLVAVNEEFPSAATPQNPQPPTRGWSAYEIWRTRIRPRPGMPSLFLSQF